MNALTAWMIALHVLTLVIYTGIIWFTPYFRYNSTGPYDPKQLPRLQKRLGIAMGLMLFWIVVLNVVWYWLR